MVQVRKVKRDFTEILNNGKMLRWEVETVDKPKQLTYVEQTVDTKSFENVPIKKRK